MKKTLKIPANNKIPGDVFPVGEFIFDEIAARGIKQVELAKGLGLSKSEISLIISGKRNITVLIALKLEKFLGISAEVWMNLQVKYEIETGKKKYAKVIKKLRSAKSRRVAA